MATSENDEIEYSFVEEHEGIFYELLDGYRFPDNIDECEQAKEIYAGKNGRRYVRLDCVLCEMQRGKNCGNKTMRVGG